MPTCTEPAPNIYHIFLIVYQLYLIILCGPLVFIFYNLMLFKLSCICNIKQRYIWFRFSASMKRPLLLTQKTQTIKEQTARWLI